MPSVSSRISLRPVGSASRSGATLRGAAPRPARRDQESLIEPSTVSRHRVRTTRNAPCPSNNPCTSEASWRQITMEGPMSITRSTSNRRSGPARQAGSSSAVSPMARAVASSSNCRSADPRTRLSGRRARPSARISARDRSRPNRTGAAASPGPGWRMPGAASSRRGCTAACKGVSCGPVPDPGTGRAVGVGGRRSSPSADVASAPEDSSAHSPRPANRATHNASARSSAETAETADTSDASDSPPMSRLKPAARSSSTGQPSLRGRRR